MPREVIMLNHRPTDNQCHQYQVPTGDLPMDLVNLRHIMDNRHHRQVIRQIRLDKWVFFSKDFEASSVVLYHLWARVTLYSTFLMKKIRCHFRYCYLKPYLKCLYDSAELENAASHPIPDLCLYLHTTVPPLLLCR
jgi:hypothetical protein